MRTGLFISLALHVAVLLWALAELPSASESAREETPSVPVDVVSVEDYTRIKAGTRDGDTEAPAAAEKPSETPVESDKESPAEPDRKAVAPPPPQPPSQEAPERAEPAEPEPAPVPVPAEEATPEPAPAPESADSGPPPPKPLRAPPAPRTAKKRVSPTEDPAKRTAEAPEKPRAEPPPSPPEQPEPQQEFNPDRIAALLDRTPTSASRQQAAMDDPPAAAPAQGEAAGQDRSLSISEIDALRARISQCWIPPVGGMDARSVRVSLRLRLNPDGTLLRHPEVLNSQDSRFFQAAADSALRAVWKCQPYRLPDEKYASWSDMVLHFDPREMFGG